MSTIYKIVGSDGGGRCSCGHIHYKGAPYYMVDMVSKSYSFCEKCAVGNHFIGTTVTSEQMRKMWFGGEKIEAVVSKRLERFAPKVIKPKKKDVMLEQAVSV